MKPAAHLLSAPALPARQRPMSVADIHVGSPGQTDLPPLPPRQPSIRSPHSSASNMGGSPHQRTLQPLPSPSKIVSTTMLPAFSPPPTGSASPNPSQPALPPRRPTGTSSDRLSDEPRMYQMPLDYSIAQHASTSRRATVDPIGAMRRSLAFDPRSTGVVQRPMSRSSSGSHPLQAPGDAPPPLPPKPKNT